ncbi:phosphoribosyl transferase domain protein [Apiospora marii]|uniref:phosphoribosyl transferase domain protein n=1 Tax=Apiospora marii TaxID=335849 RepID=UPI00312ECAE4
MTFRKPGVTPGAAPSAQHTVAGSEEAAQLALEQLRSMGQRFRTASKEQQVLIQATHVQWATMIVHYQRKRLSGSSDESRDYATCVVSAIAGVGLQYMPNDVDRDVALGSVDSILPEQVRQNPSLPEQHSLNVLRGADGVYVLFVTGMRDEALVATLVYLVPDCKLVDIRIQASEEKRWFRKGFDHGCDTVDADGGDTKKKPEHRWTAAECGWV